MKVDYREGWSVTYTLTWDGLGLCAGLPNGVVQSFYGPFDEVEESAYLAFSNRDGWYTLEDL